ncbi:MAG: hypothetical protein WCP29_04890 [Acidobacteriota bacterium]
MREFTRSAMRYALAKGLYSGQEIAKFIGISEKHVTAKNPPAPGPEGEDPKSLSGQLYRSAKQTVNKFGDPAAVMFIAGDEYQTKAIDMMFDVITLKALSPSYWVKVTDHLFTQGQLAADATIGKQESLHTQQAKNTRYVFTLVRNNPEKIGIPKTGEFDLSVFMDKAYNVGDFESIWTVEGLGHVYCQRTWHMKWDCSEDAHGLLVDGQAATMPDKSFTMMHAGLGLCVAESLMKQLTPESSTKEVERVLKIFIKLCQNNSRPGYVGSALESLGLVTRCFNFPMVDLVQKVLADVDENAWEFFYRGAGRALYFSPGHMLQPLYSPWIAAEAEAPNDRAFNILKAGISWPTNIVNMRTPAIFEDLIRRRGEKEESLGTIAHGVAASTTMACDITPNHPLVREYLEYEPASTDPKVRALWTKLVRNQAYKALHRYQPVLKAHNMMDQVFRFQDLDALVDRLDPPGEAPKAAKA